MGSAAVDYALWAVALLSLSWVVAVHAARALEWAWWRPRRLERLLREQGIGGTPYRLLFGDARDEARMRKEAQSKPLPPTSNDIAPHVVPFIHHAIKTHGRMCVTWLGPNPRVTIMEPELIKEVLSNKFGHFQKPKANPIVRRLAAGLASYEGEKWAKHRRIVNPAFHIEKLKNMLPAFLDSCTDMIDRWASLVGSGESCELDVLPQLQSLTADVISRAAFGSCYQEGRRIFELQSEQAKLISESIQMVFIPGYRFLPTERNKRTKAIHKEVTSILKDMVEKKEKVMKVGDVPVEDNLLGMLLASNMKSTQEKGNPNKGMTTDEVIEECKLFYFAGQETTNVLLTWTMILLGMHTVWQDRAREEVLQAFGKDKPSFDGLNHLKIVNMILHEVLRLYPPGIFLTRSTYKTVKLGDATFPAGVLLLMPIVFIHHDKELWGEDASEFKPERFSEGVSKASKKQQAFFPFGWGPRICLGQSFALMEAKLALAMILQHFSFELSSSYTHSPCTVITLQPKYGAPIILHGL